MDAPPSPSSAAPSRQKLARASGIAAVVAAVVLVVAVLPAEYGVDPTGIGRALGFAKLSDEAPTIIDTSGQGPETVFAFDLAWQIRDETILERTGSLKTTDVQERVIVDFDGTNLTHLTAILEWNDDDRIGGQPTDPDLFELSVEAPDGRQSQLVSSENDEAGAGRIEVKLQWRSTPMPEWDPSGKYIVDAKEDRTAQGEWKVLVRLYNAGGNSNGEDPGNAWTLRVDARTYSITNLGKFGSDEPGDHVALTLQPGGSVEYKFAMMTGKNMTYRWTSTAPLTFDFHGDRPGQEEEPTTHKQGVADRDQGNFTAPFSGRHGWWWHNAGRDPITINLTTQGEYTILGVV